MSEYTHYCENCDMELALLYDDRDDKSDPVVCGYCGKYDTRKLEADK